MNDLEEIIANIPIKNRPQVIFLENKPGESMAIVSDLKKPNEGVLILTERKEETGPFVVLPPSPQRKFPIVSLRRPPELCGIDEPEYMGEEELKEWAKPYTRAFCASLQQACEKGNIKNLYLAASSSWEQSAYAQLVEDVKVKSVVQEIIF